MADLGVSALVNDVVTRLNSEVIKEFGLFRHFEDDARALKDHYDLIEAFLQDAEEKRSEDKAVELWLQRLKSASLKVENVLDEISTEALQRRLFKELHKERELGIKYRVRTFFSSKYNRLMFRVRSAHKVKAIRIKLDDLESERSKLGLIIAAPQSHVDDMLLVRETSSLMNDSSVIFGRNEEMEMVTEKMCNKDLEKCEDGEIMVYSIWGMGGVGKTTLAQLVYNHDRVKQHFELKCWVFVSENFQVKEILKAITESASKRKCEHTSLDALQVSCQKELQGKKFLIVLDDVWIEDETNGWGELRRTLSCGAEGSIVLMTTRSQKTSQVLAKLPELQLNLGCLSKDDSWSLFKKLAFAQRRVGDDMSELESMGREIVEKCQGLPLAVDAIGRLMRTKSSTSDWQRVKNNITWELKEKNVVPALKISYDNLLPHMKRCFAYCCMFPKGHDIEKDDVIQLWIVNGFIPPRGNIDLYELGEEIFDRLVWRSFLQVQKKYFEEKYKMHDLMHGMARHVMGNDCLVIEPAGKDVKIPNEVLHLSSLSDEPFHVSSEDLGKLLSLRSIFMFREVDDGYKRLFSLIVYNQLYLRVLYLIGFKYAEVPDLVFFKLKHLKYLNLSDSLIKVLPEAIIFLQNLEVLILYYCVNMSELPEGIKYMKSLKYLGNKFCISLGHLPLGIKKLAGLRRLSTFPVDKENGAKIGELGELNLLEGELAIEGLENVGGLKEAESANIKCKTNLSALNLRWSESKRETDEKILQGEREMYEEVLEGLEPNPCLKRLKIFSYRGKTISPSWMVKLKNLVEVSFDECKNCESIPLLGRLPNLRVIKLHEMDSLKSFNDDDDTNMFLSLQELRISICRSLLFLPSNLPKLKVLKLLRCSELVSLPAEILKDLNELDIRDCVHLSERFDKESGVDWPRISHIPSIKICRPSDAVNEDEFIEGGQEIMELFMHIWKHDTFDDDDDNKATHEEGKEIMDADNEDKFSEEVR